MRFLDNLIEKRFVLNHEKNNYIVIILRILAIPFVKLSILFKVPPNAITLAGFLIGLYAIYALAHNSKNIFLICWSMSCILDYADGVVARISKKESHFGYLFDMVGDRIRLIALLAVCALGSEYVAIWIFALSAIFFQISCDLILHLFLPNKEKQDYLNIAESSSSLKEAYKVFFIVNMHSFFIFGFFVYIGDYWFLFGIIWLAWILLVDLKKAFLNNIYYMGQFNFNLNRNLLDRLGIKSDTK